MCALTLEGSAGSSESVGIATSKFHLVPGQEGDGDRGKSARRESCDAALGRGLANLALASRPLLAQGWKRVRRPLLHLSDLQGWMLTNYTPRLLRILEGRFPPFYVRLIALSGQPSIELALAIIMVSAHSVVHASC